MSLPLESWSQMLPEKFGKQSIRESSSHVLLFIFFLSVFLISKFDLTNVSTQTWDSLLIISSTPAASPSPEVIILSNDVPVSEMSQTSIWLQLKQKQREWGAAESDVSLFLKLMMFGMRARCVWDTVCAQSHKRHQNNHKTCARDLKWFLCAELEHFLKNPIFAILNLITIVHSYDSEHDNENNSMCF